MSEVVVVMIEGIAGMIFAFVGGWAWGREFERLRHDQEKEDE